MNIDIFNCVNWIRTAIITGDEHQDGSDAWSYYKLNLYKFAGSVAKLRFEYTPKSLNFTRQTIAIDDIKIYKRDSFDLSFTKLEFINISGVYDDSLFLSISNFGDSLISGPIHYSYRVNGGTILSNSIVLSNPLDKSETIQRKFKPNVNFNTNGIYEIKAWLSNSSDKNGTNDTNRIVIENNIQVANNYIEGFNAFFDGSCNLSGGTSVYNSSNFVDELKNGWIQAAEGTYYWDVQNSINCNIGGTQYLPNFDHSTGRGNFMFNAGQTAHPRAILESPFID